MNVFNKDIPEYGSSENDRFDDLESASYPLWRRYCCTVLPMLALAIMCILLAVSNALTLSVERAYRAQAASLHRSLVQSIASAEPGLLKRLSGGKDAAAASQVSAVLRREARERGLQCTAILRVDGTLLASTDAVACERFTSTAITALNTSSDIFMEQNGPPVLWTVATLVSDTSGGPPIVISTSEQAAARERLVEYDVFFWLLGLGIPLIGAAGLSTLLVFKAQREIDRRTTAMTQARLALARFVSDSTQRRIHDRTTANQRLDATVMFIDIREFSSFAESSSTEEAVALVSRVANIAFAAIIEHGGDVDRLLGDGVVAWFEGDKRTENAWLASERILSEMQKSHLPRDIGIGLHDGKIVEAEIGIADRMDATILGATVNIAARLCGAAAGSEIMASETVGSPAGEKLQVKEKVQLSLKGHQKPVLGTRVCLQACPYPPAREVELFVHGAANDPALS